MKIIVGEKINGAAYRIAAEEFQKYYAAVTGRLIPLGKEDDGDDLVLIGASFVNRIAFSLEQAGVLPKLSLKAGTDEYAVRTVEQGKRRILWLAGGSGRAVLYATYHYFEAAYGCRYYWDGEIVPKSNEQMRAAELSERPRFTYRGLRYFAHRGCKRFQAETWGFEDWKKEIDYLLKKRLNLFMLRIGQDDLFQKAFPNDVSYPTAETMDELGYFNKNQASYWEGQGYNDRRLFWSLEYRGELRKKVLSYAFERGLMHPEDCGTMTHWYSTTPDDFLRAKKPKFMAPAGGRGENTLVFDIRLDEEFSYYTQLTKAHIEHYGKAELFHTIGFAEQCFEGSREENLRMKKYVYDRYLGWIREEYPTCITLIAGWDLWLMYQGDEVSRLVAGLDESKCLIFDYTSDSVYENNFTTWDVIGKFPYVFGIFHAYESGNDLVGQYDRTEERLKIAKADEKCKGLILWPELSHSDTLIQTFFTANAWENEVVAVEACVETIAKERGGEFGKIMQSAWENALPTVKLMHWNMQKGNPDNNGLYCYYQPERFLNKVLKGEKDLLLEGLDFEAAKSALVSAKTCLEALASLPERAFLNEMLARDAADIVRTVLGRFVHVALVAEGTSVINVKAGTEKAETIAMQAKQVGELLDALVFLLSAHDDFSLYRTLCALHDEAPVFDGFEQTLKNNTVCDYCRQNIYETAKELFVPENAVMQKVLLDYAQGAPLNTTAYIEAKREILNAYFQKPLAQTDGERKGNLKEAIAFALKTLRTVKL